MCVHCAFCAKKALCDFLSSGCTCVFAGFLMNMHAIVISETTIRLGIVCNLKRIMLQLE